MIAPARAAAYDAVLAVNAGRSDLPAALARSRTKLTDERDRALAGEIATGTLRWQGAFDRIIEAFSGRAIAKLDREVVTILRISIFQLLHLDRVPASAAVDDAVQLTRRAGKKSAAGFVNALLRRVSRERNRLPLPPQPEDASSQDAALEYLSVTLSHPKWLVSRWLTRYGFAAAAEWARFNNHPAPLTLRVNTLKTTRERLAADLAIHDVRVEPARHARDALIVRSGNPLLTPLAHTGLFVVQDEASQLVGEFAAARPGERVFDACASPGGKTTQMAAEMSNTGVIVAADVRGRRIDLLKHTVAASGASCIRIVQADARVPLPAAPAFDAVLVDAPCSGLGTIRRDPDIRWRRGEADFPGLVDTQRTILEHASELVKPGGRLVYSTCSSEPEENERVVESFLASHPAFAQAAVLQTLPFRDGLEAFFAARLIRLNC